MTTQIPVAGIQMDFKLGDNAGNVARMIAQLDDPQVASAQLVVFPECAVSGYCFDSREEAWHTRKRYLGQPPTPCSLLRRNTASS